MNPIEQLKSVLCDPEGKCCITGSDEDQAIIDRALRVMADRMMRDDAAPQPPQRTWVGLTDEEIIIMSRYDLEYAALIGEVQRKLKEKNT